MKVAVRYVIIFVTLSVLPPCVLSSIAGGLPPPNSSKLDKGNSKPTTQVPLTDGDDQIITATPPQVADESHDGSNISTKSLSSERPELSDKATPGESIKIQDIDRQLIAEEVNRQVTKLKTDLKALEDKLEAHNAEEPEPPQTNLKDDRVVLFMFLGAIISLYGTIVFDRFKRFGEILRSVGKARQLYEGYPTSTTANELLRAHERAIDCWAIVRKRTMGSQRR